MSQFKPRFPSQPSRPYSRETDVKLRMSSDGYAQENADSPYNRRQSETHNIKKLSFWGNADQEGKEEEEWSERHSPAPFILGIVILVVASTLLWFLFQWASGDNTNTPPIIAADTAPFKVRPENPGGMMIPHQDKLIYGRLSQDAPQPIERLLPPPEQPMAAPPYPSPMEPPSPMAPPMNGLQHQQPYAQPTAPQQGYAPPQQGYAPQQQGYTPPQQQGYAPPQQGHPTNPMTQQGLHPQPTQQQHQPYPPVQAQAPYPPPQPLPGQTHYPTASQPQAPYGPPTAPPAMVPSTPQIPLKAASNPVAPKQVSAVEKIKPASDDENEADDGVLSDGRSELDQLIAKEVETPMKHSTKKKEVKNIKQIGLDPQKHKVQIASLPSRLMAEQEMKRLRTHHGSIFQNKPWSIQRINLGTDRGSTHRLVVGSFANHEAATKFCKKLRTEKIGCLVVNPSND